MGFFEKLKQGLAKTKNSVFGQVHNLFKNMRRVDEDLLEELEELLIMDDEGKLPAGGLDSAAGMQAYADILVQILTKNEEKNLPGCLESITGFCSRAVVVDCGSTDRTVEIAKEMGADIALFPEMWSNGYRIYDRPVEAWMAEAIDADSDYILSFSTLAKELDMAICVTLLEKCETGPKNALVLFDRHGEKRIHYAKVVEHAHAIG